MPRNLNIGVRIIGDTSGAVTVQQAMAKMGQAATDAQTVTVSATDAATAALKRQADQARKATATASTPAGLINIPNPNNIPSGPTLTLPGGAASMSGNVNAGAAAAAATAAAEATRRQAEASRQAAEAAAREAAAQAGNTTATAGNTAAKNTGAAATRAKAQAMAALALNVERATVAYAGNTTAVMVNSRALQSGTVAIAGNTTARAANATALRNSRTALSGDTTALAGNTAAFRQNAGAVNASAAARRNATAAAAAARAAASTAVVSQQNTGGTNANTSAIAANTAAMSPNVTARNKTTLATSRNTTAVAANTAAVQSNITLVVGQTSASVNNSASKRANTALINAQNTALGTNNGLLGANTAGLNANSGARNRNAGAGRNAAGASSQMGLAMMQAAYFVDDLQYGLRGFVNNIPLLLTSFGLSGGLAGVISILAVGVKVLVDHWHLFSDTLSTAGVAARKASADLFETSKASTRAAKDAEAARSAWKRHTDTIEGAARAYDDLKRNIDAATEARQDSDRQTLEKEDAQAALDIAGIEARQAEGNISDSEAIIQKRDVYRRVEKKKYELERAALDQQERDALALSKQTEENRQQLEGDNRRINLTVDKAKGTVGTGQFMTTEERKEAEDELRHMESILKEKEQLVEDTWKSKIVVPDFNEMMNFSAHSPADGLPLGFKIEKNPKYEQFKEQAVNYEAEIRAKRKALEDDRQLRNLTGLSGRQQLEEMNKAHAEKLRELELKNAEDRKPLAANPAKRATLDTVFNLKNQETTVKSGTEITKVQDALNQENEKRRIEDEANAKKEAEDKQKANAALVEQQLDRLRAKATADKQSGAFDRAKARNVTGKGGRGGSSRADRLAGIGAGAQDKEQLVNDVIKSAEAIKDGIETGEVQNLFNALQRMGAALDKRDGEYIQFGRAMLELARKLETQQKNLRK